MVCIWICGQGTGVVMGPCAKKCQDRGVPKVERVVVVEGVTVFPVNNSLRFIAVVTVVSSTLQVYVFLMPSNLPNQRTFLPSLSLHKRMVAPAMRAGQHGRLITTILRMSTPTGYPDSNHGFRSGMGV